MNPALIRCPGCDRTFNPYGLAHHISKTRDSRCREFNAASRTQSISVAIPQMAFSPTLASIQSHISGDDVPGGVFNDSPDLERQADASEFAMGQRVADAIRSACRMLLLLLLLLLLLMPVLRPR
jgi:hypothetical protein